MTWTILMLVVAVALYVFADTLLKTDAKKPNPIISYAKNGVRVVAILLLAIAVNRAGVGTVHYLTQSNPAILRQMAEGMQEQERTASSREVRNHIRRHGEEMARHAPIFGNINGSKTIWVWSDTFCSFCRRLHSELNRVVEADPEVRVVIKTFPVQGEIADITGRWTVAATLQDAAKARELYKRVMENDYWGRDPRHPNLAQTITNNLRTYAREIGLNVEQLETDAIGPVVAAELAQTRDLAQRFQIQGTPFLIIGDQTFPGAISFNQIMGALR